MRYNNLPTYLSLAKRGLEQLISYCQLRPNDHVLDVGCGTGSMAVPLTTYLNGGRYEGFDVVPLWINWCQRHISRSYPNFRFKHIDAYSRHYNSTGKLQADMLHFPHESQSFDCAMLMSVFTHMLPDGIRNYINELARVLRPGGSAFITALLLNTESRAAIGEGRSVFPLRHQYGDSLVVDPQFPETTIAIPESQLCQWFAETGFEITRVMYGSWAGRIGPENLHDNLVVTL
jgi:ubiquinone/menaquinone biosynthesis C-methylase UbiE